MARHKRIHAPKKDEPVLDISSLIDVCFLLLIYFLVTTQIVQKEQELATTIPSVKPIGDPPKIAPLHLLVDANGSISIKNETGLVELIEPILTLASYPPFPNALSSIRVSQRSPARGPL